MDFMCFVFFLVVSVLDIYCDDDRPYSLNGQSALVQLQQLINQESLLRLTLDKQVQELRVLLYELQGIYNDDLKDQVKSLTEKTKLIDNMDSTIRNLTVESIENYLSIKGMGCGGYEIRKKPIYFSVCQDSIVEYHNDNDVVRFNRSLANMGSAYDPSTSTFTPPRDGAFFLSFGYKSDKAKFTELHLTVNGINIIRGTVPGDTKYETAERSIILNLKKNDRVQITVAMKGTKLYGYANLVCFSAMSID